MTASTTHRGGQSILGRLIASTTIGLMLLALGAATAFAGNGVKAAHAAAHAAHVAHPAVHAARTAHPAVHAAQATPTSVAACKVTYGGRITAANGDKATFGGNATSAGLSGREQFQDHGPVADLNVKSIAVSAVTCSPDRTAATILGTATIDGVGPVGFQIDVTDLGEPARTDTYRLSLSTGYDTGIQLIRGGNVQIHK